VFIGRTRSRLGEPVATDAWDADADGTIRHLELACG
jgi:hypothetical protein